MIDSLAFALYEKFSFPIYTEEITQDFKVPAFLIETKHLDMKQVQKNRFFITKKYLITYYPPLENTQEDLAYILPKILTTLETIKYKEKLIRPSKKTGKITKEKIECQIDYEFYGYKKEASIELMKKLEYHF